MFCRSGSSTSTLLLAVFLCVGHWCDIQQHSRCAWVDTEPAQFIRGYDGSNRRERNTSDWVVFWGTRGGLSAMHCWMLMVLLHQKSVWESVLIYSFHNVKYKLNVVQISWLLGHVTCFNASNLFARWQRWWGLLGHRVVLQYKKKLFCCYMQALSTFSSYCETRKTRIKSLVVLSSRLLVCYRISSSMCTNLMLMMSQKKMDECGWMHCCRILMPSLHLRCV